MTEERCEHCRFAPMDTISWIGEDLTVRAQNGSLLCGAQTFMDIHEETNEPFIETYINDHEGQIIVKTETPISYCPFCGRRLRDG